MTESCATSTIAMSAYNVMAVTGGDGVDKVDLLQRLITLQHPDLGLEQLENALDSLTERNLIKEADSRFKVKDAKRRVIVNRSLKDVEVDEDGNVSGGWTGWKIKDHALGLIPIESR